MSTPSTEREASVVAGVDTHKDTHHVAVLAASTGARLGDLQVPATPAGKRQLLHFTSPFHGYKNAIDDQLEDAVAVLDAFHVVKLATAAVDEVRRRVQQDIHGH